MAINLTWFLPLSRVEGGCPKNNDLEVGER
jgi:hypothetical protein